MKSGIDLSHGYPDVRPQDDLFRHVNGKWIDTHEIPADRASDGAFHHLREKSEKNIRTIIEEAAASKAAVGTEAQKVGDLYASFMDEAKIEALGVSPLAQDFKKIQGIKTQQDFARLLGELGRRGVSTPMSVFIEVDMKDSNSYIVYLEQSGLGLPDESYYKEDQYAEIREKYVAHIERMFNFAKLPDGAGAAKRIFELESAIANFHYDVVKNREMDLTYHKMTRKQINTLLSNFDWDVWLAAGNVPASALEHVVVRQPEFNEGLNTLLTEEKISVWKEWMLWHTLSGMAAHLSSEIVNANFDFYGTTLNGTPQLRDRWKRGVSLIEGVLGEAAGKLYVERHFPAAAKKRMEELVANLIEAYRIDISELDWMGAETKKRALEKMSKFTPKIGYPDEWRDYSSLEITADDLIGNVYRATAFEVDRAITKLGKPVDRNEWHMTPQTVNAYYNPTMNEIVFPAAILQPPFFDIDADDAVNYGGIGAVIGHEIGHGFDDQGSKFDGDGNLTDWWTEADRAAFEVRTRKLIDQYNVLEPIAAPGHHVNGALTIGENIGDLGGLTIAHKAYQISLSGKNAPALDGFDGYQRLFIGWAQVWRSKNRPEAAIQRIATDPHSPDEHRCNAVLRNLNEFYEAFDVTEKDALWLAESERVRIW
ncbi:MAG: peptidase M13 [Actinobacteria bacterium]|nr:MAG: peptidase M13 [Actinomycetota bacterium]